MTFYVPTNGPGDWQRLLAEPVLHWRDGYSAKMLAECWEAANGIPREVSSLLEEIAPAPRLLFAFPEYKVPLSGASRGDSQDDIFAFVRAGFMTLAVMVEGKVDESFDRRLGDWLKGASPGSSSGWITWPVCLAWTCRTSQGQFTTNFCIARSLP